MLMKIKFYQLWRVAFIPVVLLLLASCGENRSEVSGEVVSWPELVAFDELAYRVEGLAKVKDHKAILSQRTRLLEAGWAVSPSTMPKNVSNPKKVHQLLGDLSSLVNRLAASDVPEEQLISLAEGLHPVVESLIEAAGMPHLHSNEGPNEGFLYPLFDGEGTQVGMAELKLHDDAGDIELWLTSGGHGGPAWDIPVDSKLNLEFPDLGKKIVLAVWDTSENRDEAGKVTVREGATNYFVFPGETGVDATWLVGEEFVAKAVLKLDAGSTGEIVFRPHAHHE